MALPYQAWTSSENGTFGYRRQAGIAEASMALPTHATGVMVLYADELRYSPTGPTAKVNQLDLRSCV